MGQPYRVTLDNSQLKRLREQTVGSETSQYHEEKRPIGIPLVAASETGEAQTQPQNLNSWDAQGQTLGSLKVRPYMNLDFGDGGYKATALETGGVKKCLVSGTSWKARLQRVIVPYTKTKHLYGCSS